MEASKAPALPLGYSPVCAIDTFLALTLLHNSTIVELCNIFYFSELFSHLYSYLIFGYYSAAEHTQGLIDEWILISLAGAGGVFRIIHLDNQLHFGS